MGAQTRTPVINLRFERTDSAFSWRLSQRVDAILYRQRQNSIIHNQKIGTTNTT